MENRIECLKAVLDENDAVLITDGADRFYLTGFKSSAGTVFITRKSAYFFIDFRYYENAKKTVLEFDVVLQNNLTQQLRSVINSENIKNIYVRTECLSVREFIDMNDFFEGKISDGDKLDKTLKKLRSIKTATEIDNIKTAQQYTEKTFDYILGRIEEGRTEREIMLDMEFYMRTLGSEGVAFDFIVVSGKNSSLPHGAPTDKKIQKGDFITMDFGAVYNGYCSDMTRTVALGFVNDEQKIVYNTVLEAQKKALEEIRAGKICSHIDGVAREYIDRCGYAGCFGHGLGHSVGIEIHEDPSFNTRCSTKLEKAMVMTVEPGIYIENKFGVRIEDMIVVTENGCDNLTSSEKELIII